MTTETRYFRQDQAVVNGLTAQKFLTSETSIGTYAEQVVENTNVSVYWGIRVWRRSSGGTETELTNGTPLAQVWRTTNSSGLQNTPYTPPLTNLTQNDSLVVRVYTKIGSLAWHLLATFSTGQFATVQVQAVEWTVKYYTYRNYDSGAGMVTSRFYFGSSGYQSEVDNFQYIVFVLVNVSDTILISDSTHTNKSIVIHESLSVVDKPQTGKPVYVSDSYIIGDVPLVSRPQHLGDTITLTDNVYMLILKLLQDGFTLSDALLISKTVRVIDYITLRDSTFGGKPVPEKGMLKHIVKSVSGSLSGNEVGRGLP